MNYQNVWDALSKVVGRATLLPIAQTGTVSPKSKIKSPLPFKIPSYENSDGYVVGFGDWAEKKTTSGQFSIWSRKYGLGIRCGHELPGGGYLVGVDVDIEHERTQEKVFKALKDLTGVRTLQYRHRGSERRLYMIAVREPHTKVVLTTKRGNIDVLGLGQQFVAAGAHPDGSEYEWEPRMPRRVPVVEWDDLIDAITQSARVTKKSSEKETTEFEQSDDEDELRAAAHFEEVIEWLEENADDCRNGTDYYFQSLDDSEYTSPSHEGDFMVRRPGANGYALPNVEMVHGSDIENAGDTAMEKWNYFCDVFDVPEFKRVYKKFVKAFTKRSRKTASTASVDDFEEIEDDEVATPSNIIDPRTRSPISVSGDMEEMKDSERAAILRRHYGKQVMREQASGMVHVYDGAVWTMIDEDTINYDMTRIYSANKTPFDVKDAKGATKALSMFSAPLPDAPTHLIGFANGVYDMRERSFRGYESSDFLRMHNGIEWTKPRRRERLEKHAPNFYKWLDWAVDGDADKAQRLLAALFMVLTRRHDWQLFIEVTGVGGSGKSVLTDICTLLVGAANVGVGGMDILGNAAARVDLIGKALITMPEEGGKRDSGQYIKQITGGDRMAFNPKFLKPFSTTIDAVVLCVNNTPMKFTNDNGGIARRRVLFAFDKQVPHSQRDKQLGVKIKDELPVIVRHLFALFEDPEIANGLLREQMVSDEAQQLIVESDPLSQFLALTEFTRLALGRVRWCAKSGQDPIMKVHLYETYKAFCELTGVKFVYELASFKAAVKHAMRDSGKPYNFRRSNGADFINVIFAEAADEYFRNSDEEKDAALDGFE